MKALCWHGKGDIRCDDVPDPKIEHSRDAIIKMTACAICSASVAARLKARLAGCRSLMRPLRIPSALTTLWAR